MKRHFNAVTILNWQKMSVVKVAHILPFAGVGGTEQGALRFARAANSAGFETTFFYPEGAEAVRAFCDQAGFATVAYRQIQPSYRRPGAFWKASREIADDFRRIGVQLVHCADILAAHYAGFAGYLARLPVICHVRCRHTYLSKRDQTFQLPVNRFIFVSADAWKSFGMRVRRTRGEVLYDAIADVTPRSLVEARSYYRIPTTAAVAGMAARIHPGKDFETLINSASTVARELPNAFFLIAGDYRDNPIHRGHYAKLKLLLNDLGLEDRFQFIGFEPDIARFFSAIDVAVLSTHSEGLPLSILEAIACGKAVVATKVGGIPELIRDEQTGYLVESQSPQEFAVALVKLLGSQGLRSRIANAAKKDIGERFSEAQFRDNVKNLYFRMLR